MSDQINSQFGLKKEYLDTIISILKKEEAVEQAYIFGSRVKGNYKNESDVDIALKGKNVNRRTISDITYLLNEETVMPYRFDIFNYQNIKNTGLTEHINRVGTLLYSKT